MNHYGLIGKNISYSFSPQYFKEKFERENIDNAQYDLFDITQISQIEPILKTPDLKGLNVTIPYKESVIPYLDILSPVVEKIGAANTVQFIHGKTIGHNTDVYGFKSSLLPLLKPQHKKALVLGTGGASKAVKFVLDSLNISHQTVSRKPTEQQLNYDDLDSKIIQNYTLIINCTPLGTSPNIALCPNIPYKAVNEQHLFYDLIYNPSKTTFLKNAESKGATIQNGLKMLQNQAEKSWQIWNEF